MTRDESLARAELEAKRTAVTSLSGLAGFALAYLFASTTRPLTLLYQPLQREFLIAHAAPAPAMGYYGLVLYGVVFGAVAALAASFAVRERSPSTRLVHVLFFVAVVLVGCDVGWYVHKLT